MTVAIIIGLVWVAGIVLGCLLVGRPAARGDRIASTRLAERARRGEFHHGEGWRN